MVRRTLLFVLLPILVAAGCGQKPVKLEFYNTRVIILPDGYQIRADVMIHPEDMARGMMFRESLDPDWGMLFIHGEEGNYTYWMYQVEIPLDILWLDSSRQIVEMSPNTPPCETRASECPHYGGKGKALYVLELAAGSIEKHGLAVGKTLRF